MRPVSIRWGAMHLTFLSGVVVVTSSMSCMPVDRDQQPSERNPGSLGQRLDPASALRVDPQTTQPGDGSSWASPLASVQAAVDLQAALGGGDVWVRGPGPYDALQGDPLSTLIELREGVHVIGGFAGTELVLEDRDPDATTAIVGATDAFDDSPALIV